MAKSYMQLIYIDSDDQACHTNLESAAESNAATLAMFRKFRPLDVGKEKAQFLLDYYNAKGDLADTICLDADGFTEITGLPPKSENEYRQIDTDFWNRVRAESTP